MSLIKKIFIVFASVLVLLCVCLDGWYLYIKFFGPDKIVSNTYEVGLQETTDGNKKYFAEINYFSNANFNGLELFEVKFNYFVDENKENFYSQGLQFVANSQTDILQWQYNYSEAVSDKDPYREESGWPLAKYYYAKFSSYGLKNGASIYNYTSYDDYETTTFSTNPFNKDSSFKIQLGDDLFLMKFKYRNFDNLKDLENIPFISSGESYFKTALLWNWADYYNYFSYLDVYYFSQLLYNSIRSLKYGTSQSIVFEFGDMFDYYKFEDGDYVDTALKETDKVITDLKSYYSIKVNISADGAMRASTDSIFKSIHGEVNYNTISESGDDVYFIGRTVINCNENDFEPIELGEGEFELKLKQEFISSFIEYKDSIVLNVNIDLESYGDYIKKIKLSENAFGPFVVYKVSGIDYMQKAVA